MNEKDHLIASYQATRADGSELAEPGHYYVADLLAVADRTASPELMAELEEHCRTCEPCRARIEAIRTFFDPEGDESEPPFEVLLPEFAVKPPAPGGRPINHREAEILTSRQEMPEPDPAPIARKPGAPATQEMIDTASGVASEEVASRVRAYCTGDPRYGRLLASFEEFFRDGEVEESPTEGSTLAEMTTATFQIRRGQAGTPPHAPVGPQGPVPATPAVDAASTGATSVAQTPDAKEKLPDQLRPWLPYLLAKANLPDTVLEPFLAFILERVPLRPDQRLGRELPGWLEAFAAEHPDRCGAFRPIRAEDLRKIIARAAAHRVARDYQPKPGTVGHRILEVIEKSEISNPRQFDSLALPGDLQDDPFVRRVLTRLSYEGAILETSGAELFQFAA